MIDVETIEQRAILNQRRLYESNMNRLYGDIISLLIERAGFSDKEAVKYSGLYPKWETGKEYKQNWIIVHEGSLYRIGQDHTSQEQWVPGDLGTDSLYSKIEIVDGQYEVWQQYDGVSGVYSKDQIVVDPNDSKLYISKIDVNVWGPPSEQPNYWAPYSE